MGKKVIEHIFFDFKVWGLCCKYKLQLCVPWQCFLSFLTVQLGLSNSALAVGWGCLRPLACCFSPLSLDFLLLSDRQAPTRCDPKNAVFKVPPGSIECSSS